MSIEVGEITGNKADSGWFLGERAQRDLDREAAERKLLAWGAVLGRFNRLILDNYRTAKLGLVNVVELGDVPAATNGETININKTMVAGMMAEAEVAGRYNEMVVALQGLDAHELGHLLYSPGANTQFRKDLPRAMFRVWNILEDQRMERLVIAEYRPLRKYLAMTASKFLIDQIGTATDDMLSVAYLWVVARKHVDMTVRAQLRQHMVAAHGEAMAAEVERIAKRYLHLVHPDDDTEAMALVHEMFALMNQMEVNLSTHDLLPNDDSHSGQGGKGGNVTRQRKAQQDADEQDEEDGEDDVAGADLDADNDADPFGDFDVDGDDGDDADDEADTHGEAEARGKTDLDAEHPDKDNEVDAQDIEAPPAPADIVDNLTEAIEEITEAEELVDEINDFMRQYHDTAGTLVIGGGLDSLRKMSRTPTAVPTYAPGVARALITTIEELRHELEATWMRHQSSGRLNVNRLIGARPGRLDIFDRFQTGDDDAGGAEVGIAIDVSSSMSGFEMKAVSEALWIMRTAFHALDIPTTVTAFNTNTYIVYKATDKAPAKHEMDYFGSAVSTIPAPALAALGPVLRGSEKPVKILLVLTDGGWADEKTAEREIDKMRHDGVLTILVGISGAVEHHGPHHCEIAIDIDSPNELPELMRKALVKTIREGVR